MKKILSTATLSLALILTACGEGSEADGIAASGEAIEAIPAPAGQKWSNMVSLTEAGGYVMGNPDAPLKLVEFMSITCSHCKDFGDQAFDAIRDNYVESGRVSFEVRNFVRDPLDLTASILSRCGGEGPFFALTKQALGNQAGMFEKAQDMGEAKYTQILSSGPKQRFVLLAEELDLISFFQQRGIAEDQAKTCLADETAPEKLQLQTKAAVDDYDVQGTPTFLLNGKKIDGSNWAMVETKLQEAGAR